MNPTPISPQTGLTPDEQGVYDALCEAWDRYVAIPIQHSDEQTEFRTAIHRCQDLLAIRVTRRVFPDGWPTTST